MGLHPCLAVTYTLSTFFPVQLHKQTNDDILIVQIWVSNNTITKIPPT